MRKVRTRPWDAADYLKADADIDAYLEAALEDDDPQLITAALGDIAKAKGMTKIATSPRPIFRKTARDISHEDSISQVFSQGVSEITAGGIYRLLWPRNRLERTSACVVRPEYPTKDPDPCPGAFGPVGCWSDFSRFGFRRLLPRQAFTSDTMQRCREVQ